MALKRKRDEAAGGITLFNFMLFPAEIRQRIYESYYQSLPEEHPPPSYHQDTYYKLRNTKIVSSKAREQAFFENSRCSNPLLHQSLLFVCRESYAIVWPLYMASHSLAFNRPIRFANDYLAYHPPRRLKMLKHLSLRAGDDSTTYNPASKSAMKVLVSDFERMVDHYPDVFYNLQSFTWELCDKRRWCPNRGQNERSMLDSLVNRLLLHHEQELHETDMQSSQAPLMKKWRVGQVARRRNLSVDKGVMISYEQSSMVFFERLPNDGADMIRGLRYIDVARWLYEPLTVVKSRFNQGIHSVGGPEIPYSRSSWPLAEHRRFIQAFPWSSGDIDWKSGTDALVHAVLMDVGDLRVSLDGS